MPGPKRPVPPRRRRPTTGFEGTRLEVVKRTEAKKGFVLLPRRGGVVERTFGWLGRFRRLARDYERLADTLAGWDWLAAVMLLHGKVGFTSQ